MLLAAVAAALLYASPASAASAATRGADVHAFSLGTPGVPFGFIEPLNLLFTLGDGADEQLALITPLTSVPVRDVLAKTAWMNLGDPGVDKEFRQLSWHADADPGASFEVSFSIGGGAWLVAKGDDAYAFPEDAHGKTIAIRVKMSSTDADATARFDDITVKWVKWTSRPDKPADDERKPGAGHNGSGVFVYPTAAPAAPAPVQSGGDSSYSPVAGGAGGAGGSGGGYGSGAGSGDSLAGVTEPAPEVAETAPAGQVPAPPVESAGEGAPTQVTGVLADQDDQVVAGVPYTPTTGGGSMGGDEAEAGGATRGTRVPVLFIGATTGILAVMMFGPWLFTAASLREFSRFDPRRARSRGPFGRLAR